MTVPDVVFEMVPQAVTAACWGGKLEIDLKYQMSIGNSNIQLVLVHPTMLKVYP